MVKSHIRDRLALVCSVKLLFLQHGAGMSYAWVMNDPFDINLLGTLVPEDH